MVKGWIPYFVFGLLAILIFLLPIPQPDSEPSEQYIQIEASRFSFSPEIIRVNPGDHVILDLEAIDVVHGLYLDSYDIAVTADPGQIARLEFVAGRVGSFRFRCSMACGDMHPFMIGRLQVGENIMLWRGLSFLSLVVVASIYIAIREYNGFNPNNLGE